MVVRNGKGTARYEFIVDIGDNDRRFSRTVGHDLGATADDESSDVCRVGHRRPTGCLLLHPNNGAGFDRHDRRSLHEGELVDDINSVRRPSLRLRN